MKMIRLTKGQITIVDDKDYDKYSQLNWHYSHGRAVNRNNGVNTWLHREIMGNPENLLIDHINGNPLDNRRSNLRLVTQKQNMGNARKTSKKTSSKFKGVSYAKRNKNKWMAYIGDSSKGQRKNLGSFATELEAAKAYNDAAIDMYGEYAKLNNLKGEQPELDKCPTCFREF